MFKRLRDGLFKRQDTDEEALDETEEIPQEGAEEPVAGVQDAPVSGVAVASPAPPVAPASSLPSMEPAVLGAAALEADDADTVDDVVDSGPEEAERKRGFFNPFKLSLGRTRQLFGRVNESLAQEDITDDLWDELEETLISSDVGVQTTERIMDILHERATAEQMTRGSELRAALKEELELLLGEPEPLIFSDTSPITVLLMVGVNGVGKTTSIAKLANLLKRQKHRVMLAAGDTFRAAAV